MARQTVETLLDSSNTQSLAYISVNPGPTFTYSKLQADPKSQAG